MNRRHFLRHCGVLGAALLEPNLRRKAELLAAHKAFFDGFRG